MSSPVHQLDGELLQARKCQQGDTEALAALRLQCHDMVLSILLARGASRTEAEDLLADLWSDCVPGDDDRPSLLEKFNGKCLLRNWLATVATRRWIDLKRRQARRGEFGKTDAESGETDPLDRLAAAPAGEREDALVDLLRDSLRAAFDSCPAEAMVLLRLRHMHGVSQREIVTMLGSNETSVSRMLSQAMQQIETNVLREIKKRDPWLELTWQDFLDLCDTQQTGFF
jgi:RNA polymerase sigma factor (sigma-70 family)